jgi:sugar lactone lactonase YvrE
MDAGNNRIRKVTKKGIISTMLGRGIKGYSGDGGPATAAQLNSPDSIAMDTAGNLYIADMLNHRIRKVTPTGIISTVAGTGIEGCCGDGGQATDAQLHFPYGVAVDSTGSIYIADTNNDRIRKVTRAGIIGTVAGIYGGDGNGEGELAVTTKLNRPEAVAVDSAYNLYIADTGNNRILKVTPENGKIRIVAGNGQKGYSGDGGPATAAQLDHPKGMAIDAEGNLYIADMINNRIRKVTTAGIISTIAGNGASGCRTISAGVRATAECLPWPSGVAFDSGGNLYIAALSGNQVLKLTPAGIISAISGNGFQGFTGDGGPASAAQLYGAASVALDSAGNIYVADRDNHRVRKIIKQ